MRRDWGHSRVPPPRQSRAGKRQSSASDGDRGEGLGGSGPQNSDQEAGSSEGGGRGPGVRVGGEVAHRSQPVALTLPRPAPTRLQRPGAWRPLPARVLVSGAWVGPASGFGNTLRQLLQAAGCEIKPRQVLAAPGGCHSPDPRRLPEALLTPPHPRAQAWTGH